MAGMSGSSPYAVLGTREFSRVRQFDMEERRNRILGNPKYTIAVLNSITHLLQIRELHLNLHAFVGG